MHKGRATVQPLFGRVESYRATPLLGKFIGFRFETVNGGESSVE
jgi:hypothetical protein